MSFNTKKMIIATIIVGALFLVFLGYAFSSIQKVDMDIEVMHSKAIDAKLKSIANEIIEKSSVQYVDNVSIQDINTDILLVNHQNKSACIIKGQSVLAANYEKLDKNMVYCNNFIVLVDGRKTLIINCDEILGNAAARAISYMYHYEYVTTNNLSPQSVECFQTITQDETISFYKHAMIESAINAYFNDEKLDRFYYFYDQWSYYKGTNHYQEVINYDYYDGLRTFVYAKVLDDIDINFSMKEYIDSFKNQYGIYSKDDESSVMGMLWCLLMEKQGRNIICDEDARSDIYIMLLEGVPQGQVEEKDLRNDYHEKFVKYIGRIDKIIEEHKEDMTAINPISPIITAEVYSGTIKVEDNHYIYIDYRAREEDNTLMQQDYLTAKVLPYTIEYFIRKK